MAKLTTFPLLRLPAELQLRILDFVNLPDLMALMRTSGGMMLFVTSHRSSIIQGVIETQYPEVSSVVGAPVCSREPTSATTTTEAGLNLNDSVSLWPVQEKRSSSNKDIVKAIGSFYKDLNPEELASFEEGRAYKSWRKFVKKSQWGLLSQAKVLHDILDSSILLLLNHKILVDSATLSGREFSIAAFEDGERRLENCSLYNVRCALFLWWRSQYACPRFGTPGHEGDSLDERQFTFVKLASPEIQETLRKLVKGVVLVLTRGPTFQTFREKYDPTSAEEEGLSDAERALIAREELAIKREHEYLFIGEVWRQGPRILNDTVGESQGLGPDDEEWREAQEEIIADWLEEDAELIPEQSREIWDSRPLVKMGFLE